MNKKLSEWLGQKKPPERTWHRSWELNEKEPAALFQALETAHRGPWMGTDLEYSKNIKK